MSLQSSTPSPVSPLYQAWQALLSEQPRLRARDAAQRLSVSEAELTASRLGVDTVRLRPDWASLLPALGELGYIMALTRNESAVHEKIGVYEKITTGEMASIVLGEQIDLRVFPGAWAHVFAVTKSDDQGEARKSLQFFDKWGNAVHKVHLRPESNVAAYDKIVADFRLDDQTQEFAADASVPATDDRPETVRARLQRQRPPADLLAHYRDAGKLQDVDGSLPVEQVTEELLQRLGATSSR